MEKRDTSIISVDDPEPVEWVNKNSGAPVLLLCEHAGNRIPATLNDLGLSKEVLNTHIGLDIGAAAVARKLAASLDAPLILQCYSRLVIDCNRPLNATDSIPESSDGVTIPANLKLSVPHRKTRQLEIFTPLDDAINEGFKKSKRAAVFSIHSFTPKMNGQQPRPWHAGFLDRTERGVGNALLSQIKQLRPDLTLALNEPYTIDDMSDWFIPQYAEPQQLIHSLIEIRNDQLLSNEGVNNWADLLASAINSVMEKTA